jgi:hypothetical protein
MIRYFAEERLTSNACHPRCSRNRQASISHVHAAIIEESLRRSRRFTLTSHARELLAATLVLCLCDGYAAATRGDPTDSELTVRFLSHESDFQSLLQILESDRSRLLSLGAESYEFADFVRAGAGTSHLVDYRGLLEKIGAANFRYFPRSGNLILPAPRSLDGSRGTSKSYLYLNHQELSSGQPQPLRRYQGDSWRGPGVRFVTGDKRIKGQWFIHHEGTLVVAFAPY